MILAKPAKSLFFSIFSATLALSACGQEELQDRGSASESESETLSLVSRACDQYNQNLYDPKFHCAVFRSGAGAKEVLFQLNGFDATQTQKVKDSLDVAVSRFNDHWAASSIPSPLVQCTMKYATKDFTPKGGLGAMFPETERKVVWALTITQFYYKYHLDTLQPVQINAFSENPAANGSYTMGQAIIGDDTVKVATSPYSEANMNIELNRIALGNPNFTPEAFAGTIYHEWMHRAGFDHPNGYEGSLIKEMGLCIWRNNADKGFGLTAALESLMRD